MSEPQWITDLRDELARSSTLRDFVEIDESITLGKARDLISYLDTMKYLLQSRGDNRAFTVQSP